MNFTTSWLEYSLFFPTTQQSQIEGVCVCVLFSVLLLASKVVSTHLQNTPQATFNNRLFDRIPFIVGVAGGWPFPGVRGLGVWHETSLDTCAFFMGI